MNHEAQPSPSDFEYIRLLPYELSTLNGYLGRPATALEIMAFGMYRNTCHASFTIDDKRFTLDLSSSKCPIPQEINSGLTPLIQFHNLLFGTLEATNTPSHLQTSLKEIARTYTPLQTPVVDGKITFSNAVQNTQVHKSFSLFEQTLSEETTVKEGDLILFLTTQETDLLSTALEISKKEGVKTILPIVENHLLGSLVHWGVKNNWGVQFYPEKLKLIMKEHLLDVLMQTAPNGLIIICDPTIYETLTIIINEHAIQLLKIGSVIKETMINFLTDDNVKTYAHYYEMKKARAFAYKVSTNNPHLVSNHERDTPLAMDMPEDLKQIAVQLLSHPTIASLKNIVEKGDYFPNARTTELPEPSDATITHTSSSDTSIALASSAIPLTTNDKNLIAQTVQLELIYLFQRIYASGASPKLLTVKIDLATDKQELFEVVNDTIKNSCAAFGLTDVEVNLFVSMSTDVVSICSPCLVGVIKDSPTMTNGFKHKGDLIFVIGENKEDVAGSTYENIRFNKESNDLPYFNTQKTLTTLNTVHQLIKYNLINAAHSCGKGGLFIALTEMAMPNELGFDVVSDAEIREDAFLFGETAGRILVTVNEDNEDEFLEFMLSTGLSYTLLGHVTKGKLVVDDDHYGFIQEAKDIYENALVNQIE